MDAVAVLAANQRFYDAFEALDLDLMSDLWEHSDRVACTHPGWPTLRGWGAVASSWFTLFNNGQSLQFIVTNDHAEINGDTAWVTCDENVLGAPGGATVAATNVFVRTRAGWRIVVHHGSSIAS